MNQDEKYMRLALELAQKGEGNVNPNPMVGAVVVKNNKILGKGYHKKYGGFHAEVFALEEAKEKYSEEVEGSTIYVTLEPCSHYGKTPPCAKKIIDMKIKKCVIATLDPNPLVAGKGVKLLEDAGVEVVIGVLEEEALEQNRVFFKYITTKIPYLFLKCAITLDGKIATRSGDSKWISNDKSREKVQKLRHKNMGIIIGINTLLVDNPRLNTRIKDGNDSYRIVVDSSLRTLENYNVIQKNKDKKSIIITSTEILNKDNLNNKKYELFKEKYNIKFIFLEGKNFKLKDILIELGKLKIDSVLLEGGKSFISMAFEEKLIDEGEIFIAPKIVGDKKAISFFDKLKIDNMSESINLKEPKFNIYDDNISIEFRL